MNAKSKPFIAGKVIAAVSAIVLAGCLIKNEHDKKNEQSKTSPPALTHISSSKSAVIDRDFVEQPVTGLRIKQNELSIPVSIAALSEQQLNLLFAEIELSRMGLEFFATSKSAPPKAVRNIYILEEHKGKTSQDINLTKLQQKFWEQYKAKITAWHKEKNGKQAFLNSSNAPVGNMSVNGKKKQTQIKEIFLHSSKAPAFVPDVEKKEKIFIHSSKAFAPPNIEEIKQPNSQK